MSKENEKTVKLYEKSANKYLENNIKHDNLDLDKARQKREELEKFMKLHIDSLPKGAKVMEIGCGSGENAKYIKELGYDVLASDIAEDFINAAKEKGLKTIKFNVLEEEFVEQYFAVLCWRVFVHFTREDAMKVLQKVYDILEDNGLFIFNAINREIKAVEEEWVDLPNEYTLGVERYFHYFKEEELYEMIKNTGFEICDFHKEGGKDNNKWLVYVLKK